jgi:hypothetical protein
LKIDFVAYILQAVFCGHPSLSAIVASEGGFGRYNQLNSVTYNATRGYKMDIEFFWNLIEKTFETSQGNLSQQVELLTEQLAQRSVDDIADYKKIMDDLLDNAYDASLWDAAVIINQGCGDDSFKDFRGWLIAHGKEVYEKALVDPEILVDVVKMNEWAADELFLYIAHEAYERKTGQDLLDYMGKRKKRPGLRGAFWPAETRNERFPKLAAKFGGSERWDMLP